MTKKQNKAGVAALMLAVLFLILAIQAFADEGALTPEGNMTLTDDYTSADGDKQFITRQRTGTTTTSSSTGREFLKMSTF